MELCIVFSVFILLTFAMLKVNRIFSLMNSIKTYSRVSLSHAILSILIGIFMEGPECDLFDSVPVITLSNDSVRAGRPNQKKSRNYRNFG